MSKREKIINTSFYHLSTYKNSAGITRNTLLMIDRRIQLSNESSAGVSDVSGILLLA